MVFSFCDPGIFRFSKVGEKCRFHSVYWSVISIVTMIFFFFHERLRSQYAGHACTDICLHLCFHCILPSACLCIPCKIRYNLTRILYKKTQCRLISKIFCWSSHFLKNGSNSLSLNARTWYSVFKTQWDFHFISVFFQVYGHISVVLQILQGFCIKTTTTNSSSFEVCKSIRRLDTLF